MTDSKEQPDSVDGSDSSRCYTAEDVQAAYFEGFEDGESHGNLSWKYQPMTNAYAMSDARKLIAGMPNDILQLTVAQWRNAKIDDQGRHVLPMEGVEVGKSV